MIRRRTYYYALLIWSFIYIVGTLIAPQAPTRFNITPAKTHFLQVTIALPVVLIWFAAFYGAERFKSYAQSIRSDRDGHALNTVANGLFLLVLAVVSNGISSILRPWAVRDGWLRGLTIVLNYLYVLLPLIAYYVMFRGSNELRAITTKTKESFKNWIPVAIAIAVIGTAYLLVLLNYQYRNDTPDPNQYNSFYLSDPLLLLTLALPYVVGWLLGLKSVVNIIRYQRRVQGIIYKNAIYRVAIGVLLVTSFAIILQLLIALSAYISHASLGAILLLVYVIILLYSIGFLIIASGAKRLSAIEKAGAKRV